MNAAALTRQWLTRATTARLAQSAQPSLWLLVQGTQSSALVTPRLFSTHPLQGDTEDDYSTSSNTQVVMDQYKATAAATPETKGE